MIIATRIRRALPFAMAATCLLAVGAVHAAPNSVSITARVVGAQPRDTGEALTYILSGAGHSKAFGGKLVASGTLSIDTNAERVSGTVHLITIDGDVVTLELTGSATAVSPQEGETEYAIAGNTQAVGGTGGWLGYFGYGNFHGFVRADKSLEFTFYDLHLQNQESALPD